MQQHAPGMLLILHPRHTTIKYRINVRYFIVVGEEGLEPSRLLRPADFKSAAYTNSATRPYKACPRLAVICRNERIIPDFIPAPNALPTQTSYGKVMAYARDYPSSFHYYP